jgi:hypothetical protein
MSDADVHVRKYRKTAESTRISKDPDAHLERQCSRCELWIAETLYASRTRLCTECLSAYNHDHKRNLTGRLITILTNARIDATRRKGEAAVCTITNDDVVALWSKQQGRRYYSGLEMQTDGNKDWCVSLERLDPKHGYTLNNVALIVLELNCNMTWNLKKLKSIRTLQQSLVDMDALKAQVQQARTAPVRKARGPQRQSKEAHGETMYQCVGCNQFLLRDGFRQDSAKQGGITSQCITCRRQMCQRSRSSLRGYLQKLLRTAIQSSRERGLRGRTSAGEVPTVTLDILLDMVIKQKGRCAYSRAPLVFQSGSQYEWRCSLERRDPSKGYDPDNVLLIAYEFNTSRQWNTDKVEMMLESLQSAKFNEQ